jgi:hypothetical protein
MAISTYTYFKNENYVSHTLHKRENMLLKVSGPLLRVAIPAAARRMAIPSALGGALPLSGAGGPAVASQFVKLRLDLAVEVVYRREFFHSAPLHALEVELQGPGAL